MSTAPGGDRMRSNIKSTVQDMDEEVEESVIDSPQALARLQSLADIASARLRGSASLAALTTGEAVAVLGASLSTVHKLSASDNLETIGLSRTVQLNESWVERITAYLAGEVIARRGAVSVNELESFLRERNLPPDPRINSYFGVPLCDAIGRPLGVASLYAGSGRRFSREDELWLGTAARLICDALTIEHLGHKTRETQPLWEPAETTVEPPVGEVPAPSGKKGTVLVIDDDRSFNHVICNYLKDEGYLAESAFDGLEAMRIFRPQDFHLVMTDVAMPNMNGWELIAALRVRAPDIPVVLITAYNRGMWSESHLRENGVTAVLNKPFELENLLTVLSGAIKE